VRGFEDYLLVVAGIAAVCAYIATWLLRRRASGERWSWSYITDDKPPTLVGVAVVIVSAFAITRTAIFTYQYIRALEVPQGPKAEVPPQVPLDFMVVAAICVIFVSVAAIFSAFTTASSDAIVAIMTHAFRKITRTEDKDSSHVYREANLDLDQHELEVRQAISRQNGVTTAQLLKNAESAARRSAP
jgi:lysylphosphatidylglycerol synthetase-like protein (DUF2156 family)